MQACKRRRQSQIDYDTMTVSEILKNHMREIDFKSLCNRCIDTKEPKLLAVLVVYVVQNDKSLESILPHYMLSKALMYFIQNMDEFMEAGLEPLVNECMIKLAEMNMKMIRTVEGEEKEYVERMRSLHGPPTLPNIRIEIAGKYGSKAIVDSGAQKCVIAYDVARRCGLLGRIDGTRSCTSCGVNGISTSYGSVLSVPIKIHDTVSGKKRTFYIDFVVQKASQKYLILLGQTFFQLYGCVITTRRPEDAAAGVHMVTIAVSSDSPTTRNGPSCTPALVQ